MKKIHIVFLVVLFFVVSNVAHASATTSFFYPVYDRSIDTAPYPGLWNQQHDSTVGRPANSPDTALDAYTDAKYSSSGVIGIYRTFFTFDTSAIPVDAQIKSARIIVNPIRVMYDYHDSYAYMDIFKSYQASSTNITFEDIDTCGDALTNPTPLSSDISITDFSVASSSPIMLNSLGIQSINKNGFTTLCIREGHDSANQEVVNNDGAWHESGLVLNSVKAIDIATRPYLEVTYELPNQAPTPQELIQQLVDIVTNDISNHYTQNSYFAQINNIKKFFEDGQTKRSLNQINLLIGKTIRDLWLQRIDSTAADEIQKTASELKNSIASSTNSDNVPLITQVVSPELPASATWAPEVYANGEADYPGSCGLTIAQCGCAISSMAMIGQYYGISKAIDGTDVDPGNMNTWLEDNDGYTSTGGVIWNKVLAYLGKQVGGTIQTNLSLTGFNLTNSQTIDTALSNGKPLLAFNRAHGHYFVLTQKNSDDSYLINDPYWYLTKSTNDVKDTVHHVQNYNNEINKVNEFTYSEKSHKLTQAIEIHIASPAELLLTDSQGRSTGYDQVTKTVVNEIPQSGYDQYSGIYTTDGTTTPHFEKVLMVNNADGSDYSLQVVGTGSGPYHLTIVTVDDAGVFKTSEIASTTSTSTIDSYIISAKENPNKHGFVSEIFKFVISHLGDTDREKFRHLLSTLNSQLEVANVASVPDWFLNLRQDYSENERNNTDFSGLFHKFGW